MLSLLPHWDDGGKRVDRGLVGAEGWSLFMHSLLFSCCHLSHSLSCIQKVRGIYISRSTIALCIEDIVFQHRDLNLEQEISNAS